MAQGDPFSTGGSITTLDSGNGDSSSSFDGQLEPEDGPSTPTPTPPPTPTPLDDAAAVPFNECIGELSYLELDQIQPFGFNQNTYNLKWKNGSFPDVTVLVDNQGNPLFVGKTHPYENLRDNEKIFNLLGKNDIKSLMHYSCGNKPTSVSFSFDTPFGENKEFILAIFGLAQHTQLNITAFDWGGHELMAGATWDALDKGLLSHGNTDILSMISNLNSPSLLQQHKGKGAAHGGLHGGNPHHQNPHHDDKKHGPGANVKWTGSSITSYAIFNPALTASKISKITLTIAATCKPPECKGLNLFYSLIANDICVKQTATPFVEPTEETVTIRPSRRPRPTGPPSTRTPLPTSGKKAQLKQNH
ncbi:hypothetical protein CYY_002346 [Polysphondylium violaceum]|uniref:Uncharacterized protein n=1 Tax=Polysphondylium violaceum TaxID=133409 RepID=A0A8J4PZI0_9MYCE|nr:hypothetical protein CYY_002346 [Polysphondylium violaceum]